MMCAESRRWGTATRRPRRTIQRSRRERREHGRVDRRPNACAPRWFHAARRRSLDGTRAGGAASRAAGAIRNRDSRGPALPSGAQRPEPTARGYDEIGKPRALEGRHTAAKRGELVDAPAIIGLTRAGTQFSDQAALLEARDRYVERAGARHRADAREVLDGLDDSPAVSRLLGEREQHVVRQRREWKKVGRIRVPSRVHGLSAS